MSDLPGPLTPPDCDLRGFEWMPLLGHRLFASDFDARASDLEFRVALRLWWEAWQQVPAASLPNDDAVLCRLAGLGRDTKTWKKLTGRAGAAWLHPVCRQPLVSSPACRAGDQGIRLQVETQGGTRGRDRSYEAVEGAA